MIPWAATWETKVIAASDSALIESMFDNPGVGNGQKREGKNAVQETKYKASIDEAKWE